MLRPTVLVTALALGLAGCQGCNSNKLNKSQGGLQAPDPNLNFPRTFVGYPLQLAVRLRNTATTPRSASLSVGPPFSVAGSAEVPGADFVEVPVTFDPPDAGAWGATLTVTSEGVSFPVAVTGLAELPPPCGTPADCHARHFDPDAGACVDQVLADDSACGQDQPCLVDGHCKSGQCLGSARSCDDHDVCTDDACDPATGCVHVDHASDCPAATLPCQAAYCDAVQGCAIGPAADGTICGNVDCTTAHVCLGGACTEVPPPDGTTCSPDLPCQGHGVCHAGSCQVPDAGQLLPAWRYRPDGGAQVAFTGALDFRGNLYWVECAPGGPACALVSATRDGFERYRTPFAISGDGGLPLAEGQLAVLDAAVVLEAPGAQLLAFDERLGGLSWALDLPAELVDALGCDPDAGPPGVALGPLVAPPDGGLWLTASLTPARDGGCAGWYALSVEPTAGNLLGEVALPGRPSGAVGEADGTLHLALPDAALALNADGGTRYQASLPGAGAPLGAFAGALYLPSAGGASALSTADGGALSLLALDTGARSELAVGPTRGYLSGQSWPDAGSGPALGGFDPSVAGLAWLLPLGEPGDALRGPLLTSRDTAVLLSGPDAGPPRMVEVLPTGQVAYACELPSDTPGLGPLALGNDRFYVLSTQADGGQVLQAFDVPGVEPGASGWVAPRGSSQQRGVAK